MANQFDDKMAVIMGLVAIGICSIFTVPEHATEIVKDIVISLGSIATGYSMARGNK